MPAAIAVFMLTRAFLSDRAAVGAGAARSVVVPGCMVVAPMEAQGSAGVVFKLMTILAKLEDELGVGGKVVVEVAECIWSVDVWKVPEVVDIGERELLAALFEAASGKAASVDERCRMAPERDFIKTVELEV